LGTEAEMSSERISSGTFAMLFSLQFSRKTSLRTEKYIEATGCLFVHYCSRSSVLRSAPT